MGTNFGAPQYDEETQAAPPGSDAAAAAIELDPNDPALTSEIMETDANVDAYERQPVLPDGRWRVKVKLVDIKDPKTGKASETMALLTVATWRNPPKPFWCVNLESDVIDLRAAPNFNGVRLTDYWVKTLVDERKPGASALATVIRKSGGVVPVQSNQNTVKDIAVRHFAGEPEAVIETQWVARCQRCEELADKKGEKKPGPFKRGMVNFPMANKVYNPSLDCPTCKAQVRAMPTIVQYFDVKTAITYK
jgi:hypothetical protein